MTFGRLFASLAAGVLAGTLAAPVVAGEADVVAVKVSKVESGRYRFDVTVRHADSGWEHYADFWQVLDLEGRILGERVLVHPHVDEQPFTRSLGVSLPPGIAKVRVRAHDKVHGFGTAEMVVTIPR